MRIFLATHGCRANQYDSGTVRAMLESAGHEIVLAPEGADRAVFNSCAVTADAVADLRQGVRRAARRNPALRTLVMGCAAALDGGEIAALPSVEHVIGGAPMDEIAAALGLAPEAALVRAGSQSGARALLRIQDGCDEHCTFCATTIARGAARSRPVDEIVAEAARLAEHHAEIVLTGIHIGRYGDDIDSSLGALLEALVMSIAGVRFRLSSVEASEVDDRLAGLLAGDARRVAPWLHAPLQSGSDRVLRRMGRHWYTAASYALAVERLAARAPLLGLGADVIAGFPGESDADHAATLALIERLPFTALHVFPYSERPGTAAMRLGTALPRATVIARAAELRALGERKAAAHRAARLGGVADVVVLGSTRERDGITEDHLTVRMRDSTLPRGARVRARLEGGAAGAALFARTGRE
jgi:threonylcarbamoyladenosine tRNA methylthiotransferase MtaB